MGFDLSRKRAQHEFEFYTIHYTIQGILNGHFMYPRGDLFVGRFEGSQGGCYLFHKMYCFNPMIGYMKGTFLVSNLYPLMVPTRERLLYF